MTPRERLYCLIDRKRQACGLTPADIPVEPMALAAREGEALVIQLRPFSRRGLGGVLHKGPVSLITLNDRRGPEEMRFSLAHELIHYWCDDGRAAKAFSEWRANEGAAELLVPRAVFVPLAAGEALARRGGLRDLEGDAPWLTRAAALFGVTGAVVKYRLRSLGEDILFSISAVQAAPDVV
ncbi:MAG: ImmA/IrrE family metallo-endopeptidase [Oscillospiraceae bacterium]|nr:ImmA/IrrE family metallo-endopeptidase [Oscillospiraceae bacterium]